jgi:hypothetical protein
VTPSHVFPISGGGGGGGVRGRGGGMGGRVSAGVSKRLDRMDLLCSSDGVVWATLFGCCTPLLAG